MQSHFEIDTAAELALKVFDAPFFKFFFAMIALLMSKVFNGEVQILIGLYTLILLDSITAIIYAAKEGDICSRGIFRTAVKCVVYFSMLVVARIVDQNVPIQFASPIMDSFLVITEAVSVLENFGKLGYKVPTSLLNTLRSKRPK